MWQLVDRPIRSLVLLGSMLALATSWACGQAVIHSSPAPTSFVGFGGQGAYESGTYEGSYSNGIDNANRFDNYQGDGGWVEPMQSDSYATGTCTNGNYVNDVCSGPMECPEHKPCLEQTPGRSLYWQDICGSGYRRDCEPLFHDSNRARFYGSIEGVALFRDEVANNLSPMALGGIINTSTSNLSTEFENGMRGTLGIALGDWYRLDFSWLGDFEWQDRDTVSSTTESHLLDFSASMNTGEINLRRRVRIRDWPQHYPDYWNSFEFSTLIGFRYLELGESMSYDLQSTSANDFASVTTTNKMAGIQVGGLAQWLYEDRGWLDLEVKGAILSNDLTVASTHGRTLEPADPNDPGPIAPPPGDPVNFSGDESRTSFLVDASLMFNYQFTQFLTVRLGYNMIWVSGAALATENLSADVLRPLNDAKHDGDTIFHGPSIGAVLTL